MAPVSSRSRQQSLTFQFGSNRYSPGLVRLDPGQYCGEVVKGSHPLTMAIATFPQSVLHQADGNGTISWGFARAIASLHGVTADFLSEYRSLIGERIDAGELLVWLGY